MELKYCGKEIDEDSIYCKCCEKQVKGIDVSSQNEDKLQLIEDKTSSIEEVTDEYLASATKDKHGVLYSKDGTKLFKCKDKNLGEYSIAEGTKVVCDDAFSNCIFLESIMLPKGLEFIGVRAFFGCNKLERIIVACSHDANEGVLIEKFKKLLPSELYDKIIVSSSDNMEATLNDIHANIQQEKYLFFDTETVGLPLNFHAPSSDTNNWPRMVQLSWILSSSEKNILSKGNYIIKPDGFTIPRKASRIHGITTERAMNEGKSISDVLEKFLNDLDICDFIVCHNADFDTKIVGAELIRLGKEDIVCNKKSICTMKGTVDYCELPGFYGYKFPKLRELHHKLFGTNFDNAHNSQADVEATFNCFWELRKREIL